MVKKPDKDVVAKVKTLYRLDRNARTFFDALAARSRDATATSIENMMRIANVSRAEAVSLARQIEVTGAAELYLGRRGSKTRLVWAFSCISVGQAAAGEVGELEEVQDPVPEGDELDDVADDSSSEVDLGKGLTIAEAKRLLARSLGLEPSNIEITIKA